MTCLPGRCLISFDPDDDVISKPGMKFDVILPYNGRKARTAFCHLHNNDGCFDEDLSSKRILVDRWSGTPFTVVKDGKEYEFYTISQWAILAVLDEKLDEVKGE